MAARRVWFQGRRNVSDSETFHRNFMYRCTWSTPKKVGRLTDPDRALACPPNATPWPTRRAP